MSHKFTGNLKGKSEYIFRQSAGNVAHIIVNRTDYLDALRTQFAEPLYLETLCGKRLKYSVYERYGSTVAERNNAVRNSCEYCFTEWEPEDTPLVQELPRGDLPF